MPLAIVKQATLYKVSNILHYSKLAQCLTGKIKYIHDVLSKLAYATNKLDFLIFPHVPKKTAQQQTK